MGPLRFAIAAAALLLAAPAAAGNVEQWRPIIAEASIRFGIPETWIARVMRAESGGNTMLNGRPITSHAGAMGLMQVMSATYRAMARMHGLGLDPHNPRDNILAGTAYLRAMYDRYGYPGLFAAYNAGPGRYEDHLRTGRTLPGETRAYLAQLTGSTRPGRFSRQPRTSESMSAERQTDSIFFAIRPRGSGVPAAGTSPQPQLFVRIGGLSSASE